MLFRSPHVTPAQLASLLLDRSCPRPASLGAAEGWWRETLAAVNTGETLLEGVWHADEVVTAKIGEDDARQIYQKAMADLPNDRPSGPQQEPFIMGQIMPKLRGKVAGQLVRTWLQEDLA